MSEDSKLPLKVVPPLESDYYRPEHPGGSTKIFEDPTVEYRNRLVEELEKVKKLYAHSFSEDPRVPAVARVKLKLEAVAKSHRPNRIFEQDTCPIIGAEGIGRLLVSVTPRGLDRLQRAIETDFTQKGKANLSTLSAIEPVTPILDLPDGLDHPLKVKLFLHHNPSADAALEHAFIRLLTQYDGALGREVVYGPGVKVFKILRRMPELLHKLETFVGTQSVSFFPVYHPVQTQSLPVGRVAPDEFPPPTPGVVYPVLGIIDSGACCKDGTLGPWIEHRDSFVLPEEEDCGHGTFVAGLAIHAAALNHNDIRFPSCSAKILDIVAYPTSGLSEDNLLAILEEVLPKYPHVKIWNLSLGTSKRISDDSFSDFAVALDHLQRRYGVLFVLAAGNYTTTPLRPWPPSTVRCNNRLCAPADSVRSLVVGSVAHRDHSSTAVRNEEPSPFSRKGPGPIFITKPDLAHYGGNCTFAGDYRQSGVMSLDGNGNIVENIGTSFSAPLVSSLAANLHSLTSVPMSINLTKALLIHSAALRSNPATHIDTMQYCGFGTPPDLSGIISCEPWMCTLIFEPPIHTGVEYKKVNFPIPHGLVSDSGELKAEVLMTLVYDPELEASYGSEYCRTNVEVSLGTLKVNKKGKLCHNKEIGEDADSKASLFESDRVKHKYKWSPVKVYRRTMSRANGRDPWQLRISMTHRDGPTPTFKQEAALIITIADPGRREPVYNQMVTMMNQLGWRAYDLAIQQRLRV